ncbi:hypothetical protein ERO13_A07G158305v2 [Gossypium hirsutum]|nr:hypothetical protein ERO13_A07G158305v2 [Gossypium hirsutum]
MSVQSFIQECGFDPTISACDEIWDLVQYHLVDVIVYEFYVALKDRKNHRQGETITQVTIQGKEVLTAPLEIYQFYDALYYSHDYLENINLFTFDNLDMEGIINCLIIINYLIEDRCEWTRNANIEMPLKFNTVIKLLMTKLWMQFICTRLAHTHNASDITIYRAMMKCLRSRKQSMYFPHLITTLCRRAEVLMSSVEPFTRLTTSVIRDNMYGQFVELQRKQK